MGGFFAKSGNNRGAFPDTSIEEEKSLFTNDDEKTSACPCAIEDNPVNPVDPATSCEPADPVYLPVEEPGDSFNMLQYRITGSCCTYAEVLIEWLDINNITQSTIIYKPKAPTETIVCAIEGSVCFTITDDGGFVGSPFCPWPNNVPCPPGQTCGLSANPTLELIGNC